DLREDDLLAHSHRVVAASVERARVETAEVADTRDRDRHQTVEELPHPRAAQGDRHADGHSVADLEARDGLAGAPDVRLLPRDGGQLLGSAVQQLGVRLGLAHTHVQRDLLDPRHLLDARVAEALQELRAYLVEVPGLETRLDLRLGERHQSIASPDLAAMRLRRPSSRLTRTRVGSFVFGSSSITLLTWIGPSFSITPPISPPRWVSRTVVGRWCRFTMFAPSTYTRSRLTSTRRTRPVRPLDLPDMTFTVSSLRIFIAGDS